MNATYQIWTETTFLPKGREDENCWPWSVTPIDSIAAPKCTGCRTTIRCQWQQFCVVGSYYDRLLLFRGYSKTRHTNLRVEVKVSKLPKRDRLRLCTMFLWRGESVRVGISTCTCRNCCFVVFRPWTCTPVLGVSRVLGAEMRLKDLKNSNT